MWCRLIISLNAVAPLAVSCVAAEIELQPSADTTLHEDAPSNNLGAHSHVAAGVTALGDSVRGLFRFDLATVPTNAVITAVSITFNLPAISRGDASGSPYALHRMLTTWGEGTKSGNQGRPATAGEATWLHSASPTTWAAPGGMAGTDFAAEPSAVQVLGPAPGVYTVSSNPALIADIQEWRANPQQNFGWMLKIADESVNLTARRFSSRESASPPTLRIEYNLPAEEIRITSIERVDNNVVIRWTGGQGSVVVQRTAALIGTGWESVGTSTSGEFTDPAQNAAAFYRLQN